jgi:hypothetical protein
MESAPWSKDLTMRNLTMKKDIDDAAVSNDSNDDIEATPETITRKSISLMKMQAALQKMGRLRLR